MSEPFLMCSVMGRKPNHPGVLLRDCPLTKRRGCKYHSS